MLLYCLLGMELQVNLKNQLYLSPNVINSLEKIALSLLDVELKLHDLYKLYSRM